MSTLSLYTSSAPVFTKTLTAMNGCLDKAEAFASAKKFETGVLCVARLAPDMLSLTGQIYLASAFAKNAVCRLANRTPPDFAALEDNFTAYRARIEETLQIVGSVTPEDFAGADEREISLKVGPDKTLTMNGQEFLLHFVLPNFYFHATAAYSILRHNGVELGKADFMGVKL